MALGRRHAVVVVVVAVAAGAVAVQSRRQAADDEGRAREAAAAAEARQDEGARAGGPAGGADGRDGGGGLLGRLLDALGGGAEGGNGGVTTALLEDCASALAGSSPGSAGLLPGRSPAKADPGEQLRQIATALQELRMLQFKRLPEPVYVTPEEMTKRVQAEVSASLPAEAAADVTRALVALGALPPGADLRALTLQALGEQVAGYYDPANGELVVARSGASGGLDGQDRIVLAHELDHALTDQVIGLPADDDQPAPGAEDAALAHLALIEGDGTLAMQLYGLSYVPLLDQLGGLGDALASQDQLAQLPPYVQRSLMFPYVAGLSFACALYEAGGWAAIDTAYKAPPSSTAQVLFPERYLAGEAAVDPRDPTAPGGAWSARPRRSFGAAELRWLLEAPGGDTDEAIDNADQRAGGWAGGELQVWVDGDRTAIGMALVQRDGQPPLCATMTAWYAAAFPGGTRVARQPGEELAVDGARQDAVVRCADADVRIGIAPDVATARTIVG